jgi:hypothetical protein
LFENQNIPKELIHIDIFLSKNIFENKQTHFREKILGFVVSGLAVGLMNKIDI